MEEGPEPQEWVERSVEHHHQHHDEHQAADANRRSTMLSAITAAVLAVFAAFGSLLSGHEANQAILHLTKANDQWAYYQSKSTKGHVYEVGKEVVKALMQEGDSQARARPVLDRFDKQIQKYEVEKKEPLTQAEQLGRLSDHEFEKHHFFALGIVAFQIGIVLASISIMVRYRLLWGASLFAGLVGLLFLARGVLHTGSATETAGGKEHAAIISRLEEV